MKSRSYSYEINRTRSRHGRKLVHIKKFLSMIYDKATFLAQFMKKLSNTKAEWK